MSSRSRFYLIVAVAGASVASILGSVLLRGAARLSDEDAKIVTDLTSVEAALAWRLAVEQAVPVDISIEGLVAEGYTSLKEDEFTNWVHYVNWDYIDDERVLDPAQPESYLFKVQSDGSRKLMALVYSMPERYTYANTPDIAEGAGVWHTHPTTCLGGDPFEDPSLAWIDGACANGPNFPNRLMIHAWVEPNLCGPFAAVIIEADPSLPEVSQKYIRERLAGFDKEGKVPGCEEELAKQTWPEAFR